MAEPSGLVKEMEDHTLEGEPQEDHADEYVFDGGSEEGDVDEWGDDAFKEESDDVDYGEGDAPATATPAETRPGEEIDLAAFRTGWVQSLNLTNKAVRASETADLAPPYVLAVLQNPTLLSRILSTPTLFTRDHCRIALVASPFLAPSRELIFSSIHLSTPEQTRSILRLFQTKPELAALSKSVTLSLADLPSLVREIDLIKTKLESLREAQDAEEPEWYYPSTVAGLPAGSGVPGHRKWERELWESLPFDADANAFERARSTQLFEEVVSPAMLSTEEVREVYDGIENVYAESRAFDPAILGVGP